MVANTVEERVGLTLSMVRGEQVAEKKHQNGTHSHLNSIAGEYCSEWSRTECGTGTADNRYPTGARSSIKEWSIEWITWQKVSKSAYAFFFPFRKRWVLGKR